MPEIITIFAFACCPYTYRTAVHVFFMSKYFLKTTNFWGEIVFSVTIFFTNILLKMLFCDKIFFLKTNFIFEKKNCDKIFFNINFGTRNRVTRYRRQARNRNSTSFAARRHASPRVANASHVSNRSEFWEFCTLMKRHD